MKPDDFLIRTTIRIEVKKKDGIGTGTGFFYLFELEGTEIPVIVTNKHVIKDGLEGKLIFSVADDEGNILENQKHNLKITEFEKVWILHPDDNIDLCIMPLAPIIEDTRRQNINLVCNVLRKEDIVNEKETEELSKLEDVTIIGYPDGIWDSYNNLPILRRGITATPICYDFENTPKFLIDAAIYGGSSGSPVFIFNQGSYSINNALYAGSRMKFVGIVYAVAQHTITGEMKIIDIPTVNIPVSVMQIPNNLGVVIKANQLFVFEEILKNIVKKQIENYHN